MSIDDDFDRLIEGASQRIAIQLPSGAKLSIVAGRNAYSNPRKTTRDAYTHVECGILCGMIPDSWKEYQESDDSLVFPYLPVELISNWIIRNLSAREGDEGWKIW